MSPLKCCIVVSLITFLNSIEVMVSGHYHVQLDPQRRPGSHVLGSEMVPPEELKHRRAIGAQQGTCARSQRCLLAQLAPLCQCFVSWSSLPASSSSYTTQEVQYRWSSGDTTLPKVVKGSRMEPFFSSNETWVKFEFHKPTDLIRKADYNWPPKMISW